MKTEQAGLDPLFVALYNFRRRKFEECANICTKLLQENSVDQAVWLLKVRSLSEQVYVDEIETEEDGLANDYMDSYSIAQTPRPGTSLKTTTMKKSSDTTLGQSIRPVTQTGRPVSGVVRPGTQGRPKTVEQALKTPRTARTARPVTGSVGRFVRLGTASMVFEGDGDSEFINVARLNLSKYAMSPTLSRPLFEYLLHCQGDVKHALDLAKLVCESSKTSDWWWSSRLSLCLMKYGLLREAERELRKWLKSNQTHPSIHVILGKIYIKMDQPLAALNVWKLGLLTFQRDTALMLEIARTEEALNNASESIALYKQILVEDATSIESIACIGMNHFYSDQPELALRYYRRLLQMGIHNSEVFNNIGLCCFYAQQYDMIINCFQRALILSDNEETLSDIWYNIGHVALGIGDILLAYECYRLSVSFNQNHIESYNNLGVIEMKRNNLDKAKLYFNAAQSISSVVYEPHYNYSLLTKKTGDLHSSLISIKKSLDIYPHHSESEKVFRQLQQHFNNV